MHYRIEDEAQRQLRDQVDHHHVIIDSYGRDREKYPSSSDYWIDLPSDLLFVRSVRVVSSYVPLDAAYLVGVNESRRKLPLRRGAAAGGARVDVSMDVGDYPGGQADLAGMLAQRVNAVWPQSDFRLEYDSRRDAFTLSSAEEFALDWTACPDHVCAWNSARILGFSLGESYTSSPSGTRHVIVAPHRCNLSKPDSAAVLRITPSAELMISAQEAVDRAFVLLTDDRTTVYEEGLETWQKRWSTPIGRVARIRVTLHDAFDGLPIDLQNREHRIELVFTTSRHRH